MNQEYIENIGEGISLGLQYDYRCIKYNGQYVIYDIRDELIVECIENKEQEFCSFDTAMKRLYKINGLEMILDDDRKKL